MHTEKKLAIYMDHAHAHLIEFPSDEINNKMIHSDFTHDEKESSLGKSENLMHNKEQHQQSEYYKEIGKTIKNYDEVLLCGPTTAKSELLNLLKKDHLFEKININVQQTDKMNLNQLHVFVKNHFTPGNL